MPHSVLRCVQKKRHQTLKTAEKAREAMMKKHEGAEFHAYYCGMCQGYHVGKPKGQKKA